MARYRNERLDPKAADRCPLADDELSNKDGSRIDPDLRTLLSVQLSRFLLESILRNRENLRTNKRR